jgi:hypothetical protein
MQTLHEIRPLVSPVDTAAAMRGLVEAYASDIGDKAKWPLLRFYDYVKALDFRSDPVGQEAIARPKYTMQQGWPWRDCDDKSILIGSWLYLNKIPFRFQASSKKDDGRLHHVYVVAKVNGKDLIIDATYPQNELGYHDPAITRRQDLTGEIMNGSTISIFSGEEQEALGDDLRSMCTPPPQLLGSFFGRMARRVKNVAKQATSVADPILSAAAAAGVPGASQAEGYVKKAEGMIDKYGGKDGRGMVRHHPGIPKPILYGGAGLLLLGGIYLVARKK